jgi:type IV pilus assembly protein PilB
MSTIAAPSQVPFEYPPGLFPPTKWQAGLRGVIGEVIVELGFASRETVEAAVVISREQGRLTGEVLVEQGALTADQLTRALAERVGVDYIDLALFEVDPDCVGLIDAATARKYQSVPVKTLPQGELLLAMADPMNVVTLDEISMIAGRKVRPAAVAAQDVAWLISRFGRSDAIADNAPLEPPEALDVTVVGGADDDAPTIKLVHEVIARGIEAGASDVHLDPTPGDMRIMFRVDGVLTEGGAVPRAMVPTVVSRIKIMSALDIAERRAPQDGRLRVSLEERSVDLRVTTLPLVGGEGVVMRLLDAGTVVRELDSLGMGSGDQDRFRGAINKPYGAVLVTGPTGAGKTTTLYGALTAINDGQRSILTIEDPVESPIHGIKQMQVTPKAGVTFATGLRSILRADPDVIMVGEIRDRETAEIAIRSAITGHLMLSTLHTRNAASAATRLVDMGIEPFMVAAAIDCVVAQRLARTLCNNCKKEATTSDKVLAEHGLKGAQTFEPVGCMRCGGTGFRGRIGLYEVMVVTDEMRDLLVSHAGVPALSAAAAASGMRTMREAGVEQVREGLTSLVEVTRVTTGV